MNAEWKPSDSNNDVIKIFEAHSLIPSDPLFDDALGLVSLYADRIRKRLEELPASVNSQKAIIAMLEEGFMQEGIIPNSHERQFEMPVK